MVSLQILSLALAIFGPHGIILENCWPELTMNDTSRITTWTVCFSLEEREKEGKENEGGAQAIENWRWRNALCIRGLCKINSGKCISEEHMRLSSKRRKKIKSLMVSHGKVIPFSPSSLPSHGSFEHWKMTRPALFFLPPSLPLMTVWGRVSA